MFLISDNISLTIQFFVFRGDSNHFSRTVKSYQKFNNHTAKICTKTCQYKRYIYLIVSSIILFAVFQHTLRSLIIAMMTVITVISQVGKHYLYLAQIK